MNTHYPEIKDAEMVLHEIINTGYNLTPEGENKILDAIDVLRELHDRMEGIEPLEPEEDPEYMDGPDVEDLPGDVQVSHGEKKPYKRMGETLSNTEPRAGRYPTNPSPLQESLERAKLVSESLGDLNEIRFDYSELRDNEQPVRELMFEDDVIVITYLTTIDMPEYEIVNKVNDTINDVEGVFRETDEFIVIDHYQGNMETMWIYDKETQEETVTGHRWAPLSDRSTNESLNNQPGLSEDDEFVYDDNPDEYEETGPDSHEYWEEVANALGGEVESFDVDDESRTILIRFKDGNFVKIEHNWRYDGSEGKPLTAINGDLQYGRMAVWDDDPRSYAEDIGPKFFNWDNGFDENDETDFSEW